MRRTIIGALAAIAVAIGALGVYVATRFEGPPVDSTAALVPAEASAYVSFFVDPSSDQKKLLSDTVEGAGEDVDVGSLVEQILDRVTRSHGLPFDDVSPWIDRQMALFAVGRSDSAVVVAIGDAEGAREAMAEVGGRIFGDHAVFGDRAALRAVEEVMDSGPRSSLAEEGIIFEDAIDVVPDDRLALATATGGDLSSRAIDLPPGLDPLELLIGIGQGNAVSLRATQHGLVFDGFSYSDGAILLLAGEDRPLKDIGAADGDAWLAGVIPNLSAAVEALDLELRQAHRVGSAPIERLPLPRALEGTDQTLFWVAGDNLTSLSGGMDATTDGAESSAALVRALDRVPGFEGRFGFRRNGVSAVFGANAGAGGLGSDGSFRRSTEALGGLTPIGYLDVDRSRGVLSLLAAGAGITYPEWLNNLERVVVGLDPQANPTAWRVAVTLAR